MRRAAAARAPHALVVNVASTSASMPVHEATTAGLIAFTQAMNRELGPQGIRSIVLTPDRDAIHTRDVAEAVRALL